MRFAVSLLLLTAAALLTGCERRKEPKTQAVARSAEEIRPLLVGARLPELSLKTVDARPFDLSAAIAEKPAVIIFYRGGWCVYCNTQMARLLQIEQQIRDLGFQIIAISPDKPEKLAETMDKHQMGYTLLSDSTMTAAKAFGIAFELDDATIAKYAEYGINLDDASGQSHHLLPVPSVFVVGTDGIIKFEYVNPDYKVRIAPEVLLAAAKAEAAGNK
ncbi:MAG: peroxiredoxin-like family protein [Planctomycetota bacterium]